MISLANISSLSEKSSAKHTEDVCQENLRTQTWIKDYSDLCGTHFKEFLWDIPRFRLKFKTNQTFTVTAGILISQVVDQLIRKTRNYDLIKNIYPHIQEAVTPEHYMLQLTTIY